MIPATDDRSKQGSVEKKEEILQKCLDFIVEEEKKLPTPSRLHLFYEELKEADHPTLPDSAQPATSNLVVIYSSSGSFDRNHSGAVLLSKGFALYNDCSINLVGAQPSSMNQVQQPLHHHSILNPPTQNSTNNQSSADAVNQQPQSQRSVPSTESSKTLTSEEKEKLDKEYAESCDKLLNEQLLSWFPGQFEKDEKDDEPVQSGEAVQLGGNTTGQGANSSVAPNDSSTTKKKTRKKKMKPAMVQGEVLLVQGTIVDQLSSMNMPITLNFYKDFFFSVYSCINQSRYKKVLLKDRKWSSRFAYHDFTAPWMKRTLSVRNEIVYLNSDASICIPHYKSLRSVDGSRKAKYILSAFYENEPCIRPIFKKVLYDTASIVFLSIPQQAP